jgi:hypothetical protein
MGSPLEISIRILIVRRTARIIGKEDKGFEITVRSAIGVKKNPDAIALFAKVRAGMTRSGARTRAGRDSRLPARHKLLIENGN